MKEIRHLLTPKNIFNLNILEIYKSDSDFEVYVKEQNHNYFSLTEIELEDYKNILKSNYYDVIFMDYNTPNNNLIFDIVDYTLKNSGKGLLSLENDDSFSLMGFESYKTMNNNYIYKNIDVVGFKEEEKRKQEEEKRKQEEEKRKQEEEKRKQEEEKIKQEEEKRKQEEEKRHKEKNLIWLKKVEKIKIEQKKPKNSILNSKTKEYSFGSLSINEQKIKRKPKPKKSLVVKEKPKNNINKVNIKKELPKKVKNNINIRPKRGSRPKL